MRKNTVFTAALVAAFGLLMASSAALGRVLEEVTDSYALDEGGKVTIENVNGSIEIMGWDGSDVRVEYRITGKSDKALDRVKVKIKDNPSHLRIETVHTKSKSWWGGDGGASVSYTLKVPRSAELESVETVNGSLRIEGVSGRVDADTVNGDIEVSELQSDAKLSTVNGSIKAQFDRFGDDQRVSIDSVNGKIVVYMPDSADVDIRAETVHGGLKNDFGLPVEKGFVGRDLRGKLGSGGGRLSLDTVNGSISIRNN
ncbi:MAG: DUF4097 family beta strand repeat-containing protein [Xanthomonadales bacterium]|nr:DUF4097 family beta strand repeat-containing protein [Xanthomonadales bacterium]